MIGIVDTGGANHASVQNAIARLGLQSTISVDPTVLEACSHLILPGVGHAAHAMQRLRESHLVEFLRGQVKPVLGICLGLQILFSYSAEGDAECLDLLPGQVTRLQPSAGFRVPHMGWSRLATLSKPSHLLRNIDPAAYFYFVHSYVVPDGPSVVASTPAPHAVPAVLEFNNFWAVQFHPERSGAAGAQLMQNFFASGLVPPQGAQV